MIPSVGRIVHYTLGDSDVLIARKYRHTYTQCVGNEVTAGEKYPLLITKLWTDQPQENSAVNGQVFLDGNYSIWVSSRQQGIDKEQWSDPRGN